jgi:hypothetical protein
MKNKQILAIALIISIICLGCEKNKDKDDPTADLSANAEGLYSGTFVVVGTGQVSGTCQVTRVSNTSVNIKIRAGGSISPVSPAINVSDGGSGKIILSYSDSEGTINGTIVNKTLSLTIKAGTVTETFSGTKP